MVFLTNLAPYSEPFTYGIFGVQYTTLTPQKQALISTLFTLIAQSAGRLDILQDEKHDLPEPPGPRTTTFVAYWLFSSEYQKWVTSQSVKDFWSSLPDDAGVWREVMTVPKSRFTCASSQDIRSGIATLMELEHSTDEGYWGVYRHRMSETPDKFTDPEDKFTSAYITSAKEKDDRPVLQIPNAFKGEIRRGRVRPKIPDNLVFAREGQRLPNLLADELDAWREIINPHAQSWIQHLNTERSKTGVVAFTTHLGRENHVSKPAELAGLKANGNEMVETLQGEPIPETNQLAYFIDLAHFELAGRSHKGHVQLRKNVMNLYGPGGKLQLGKAVLFVELCVLKSEDMDAEYVGCVEGTGLMYLEGAL
ncbi:heme-containing dehydratase protein [Bisporella sp. PMI_857]|nr:heme-containing dehydratase protein [Bisporella sp. PMI_857]